MDNNLIEDNHTVEPEKLDLRSHDMTEDKGNAVQNSKIKGVTSLGSLLSIQKLEEA